MRNLLMSAMLCVLAQCPAFGEDPAMTTTTVYDIPVLPMKAAGDSTTTLRAYKGDVLLLVNVASKCGFTPQYEALEALHRKYKDQGLRVLGFPCNDFGGQEPGTELEITTFCKTKYDVTFPLYAKLHTKGPDKSPLYQYLTGDGSPVPGDVKWNFEKFLISRDGRIVERFRSATKPDSPELTAAVEKELAAK
jgi:glutathione peroxidase